MRSLAPWAILVAVALAYPLATLARGSPEFPSRDECAHRATHDGEIEAIFGRFDSEREAVLVRDRALEVGFPGTEIAHDGCGRVKVLLRGITTLEVGNEFVEEARTVGFDVTLEQAG